MALRAIFCQQNVPLNAEPLREAVTSLVPDTAGIVEWGDYAVSQQATANMSVSVAPGRAWTPGTTAVVSGEGFSTQGKYFAMNDAPYTVTIAPADAQNPRIDTVYLLVPDSAVSGATDAATIAVAQGNPAATPTAAAAPAGALALANVRVNAGATTVTSGSITSLAVPYSYRHAEVTYTQMAYPNSGGAWGPGTGGSFDTGNTFNNDFCSIVQDGVQVTKTGLYLFHATLTGASSGPPNGEFFLKNSTSGVWIAADDLGRATTWNPYCHGITAIVTAPSTVIVQTQNRTAGWNATCRLKITKVG